jgi:hypothetical protein
MVPMGNGDEEFFSIPIPFYHWEKNFLRLHLRGKKLSHPRPLRADLVTSDLKGIRRGESPFLFNLIRKGVYP